MKLRILVALAASVAPATLARADDVGDASRAAAPPVVNPPLTNAAWAFAPPLYEPDPFQHDPLLPASIVVTVTGVLSLLGGGIGWGASDGGQRCDASGCVTELPRAGRAVGSAFVGIGAGLTIAGAIGLGATLGSPLRSGDERRRPAAATAGYLLASISLGALGGAFVFGGASELRPEFGDAAPFFVTSALAAVAAVPLLVVGAQPASESERIEEARAREEKAREEQGLEYAASHGWIETEMSSPVAVGIGTTLVVGGTAGAITFGVLASSVHGGGGFLDFSGLERLAYIGGAVLSAGVGLGVGIPLIAVGAKQVPKRRRSVGTEPPVRVSVGAGTISLDGAF